MYAAKHPIDYIRFIIQEIGVREYARLWWMTWVCRLHGHVWRQHESYEDFYMYERWQECDRCQRFEFLEEANL